MDAWPYDGGSAYVAEQKKVGYTMTASLHSKIRPFSWATVITSCWKQPKVVADRKTPWLSLAISRTSGRAR